MESIWIIDVETANQNRGSICQIGLARIEAGVITETWETLVNPETDFAGWNMRVHGIGPKHVADAPTFAQVINLVRAKIEGGMLGSHTPFDRQAMDKACERACVPYLDVTWFDTARIARQTWNTVKLAELANMMGLEFNHHAAADDARMAGEVLLAAERQTGKSLPELMKRRVKPAAAKQPAKSTKHAKPLANLDGKLVGTVICFTGAIGIPRAKAAALAAEAGCKVAGSVTKKTTLVVVGEQDTKRLAGHKISSKHRRALELIEKGHGLRIIDDVEFARLVEV